MAEIKAKETDMEIQTTIKDLPEKVRQLGISPETSVRLIINDVRVKTNRKKSHFPFLNGEVWDDKEGFTDISENVDHYLYDSDNIHG